MSDKWEDEIDRSGSKELVTAKNYLSMDVDELVSKFGLSIEEVLVIVQEECIRWLNKSLESKEVDSET